MTDERLESSIDRVGDRLQAVLEGLVGPASPSAVFSEPQPVGDDLVFTAAAWERGGGFGFGIGEGKDADGSGGSGGGAGGGGGSSGRPVAVIRVGADGIEVRPVLDLTRIGVTLLTAGVGVWSALRGTVTRTR